VPIQVIGKSRHSHIRPLQDTWRWLRWWRRARRARTRKPEADGRPELR
jgi:hypothetical protein